MSLLNNIPQEEWPTTAQLAELASHVYIGGNADLAVERAIDIWVAAYQSLHQEDLNEKETPA